MQTFAKRRLIEARPFTEKEEAIEVQRAYRRTTDYEARVIARTVRAGGVGVVVWVLVVRERAIDLAGGDSITIG